jgi:hypothetical protein
MVVDAINSHGMPQVIGPPGLATPMMVTVTGPPTVDVPLAVNVN